MDLEHNISVQKQVSRAENNVYTCIDREEIRQFPTYHYGVTSMYENNSHQTHYVTSTPILFQSIKLVPYQQN